MRQTLADVPHYASAWPSAHGAAWALSTIKISGPHHHDPSDRCLRFVVTVARVQITTTQDSLPTRGVFAPRRRDFHPWVTH